MTQRCAEAGRFAAPAAAQEPAAVDAASYRSLLRDRTVAELLVASIAARLPLGMIGLALLLFARQATGSYAAAGIAVGAMSIGQGLMTPVQGRLIDRFGTTRVLIPGVTAHTLALAGVIAAGHWDASTAAIIALAGLAGLAMPPVSAAVRGLWPKLASATRLERLYALDAVIQEIAWTGGPLLVAVSVAFASPTAALVVYGALSLIGTVWLCFTPIARSERGSAGVRGLGALRHAGIRVVMGTVFFTGLVFASLQLVLPALATRLGQPEAVAGALLALWSIGSAIGGLAYGLIRWRAPVQVRYLRLLFLSGVSAVPLAFAGSLLSAALLTVVAGLVLAPMVSCQYVLVAALAPTGAKTEAFTWMTSALFVGLASGSALGGLAVQEGGIDAIVGLLMASAVCATLVAYAGRRSLLVPP